MSRIRHHGIAILRANQRSTERAPAPFRMMSIRSESSMTKYSIPSPLFLPYQFIIHPSRKWTTTAPIKMTTSPPAATLDRKPKRRAALPKDCPMMISHPMLLGIPRASRSFRVPSIPGPPNHPKSFCIPYGKTMSPATILRKVHA
jgi:hypothetical protein